MFSYLVLAAVTTVGTTIAITIGTVGAIVEKLSNAMSPIPEVEYLIPSGNCGIPAVAGYAPRSITTHRRTPSESIDGSSTPRVAGYFSGSVHNRYAHVIDQKNYLVARQ
jgi:hypothetical protein